MSIQVQTTSQGAILYDTVKVNQLDEAMFTSEYWQARHAVSAHAGGRGGVLFIRNDQYHWVLRHYRRGGLIAK